MKLSNQAIGSIMMALQNAILNQEDITQTLQKFQLKVEKEDELIVTNPPSVNVEDEGDDA